MYTEEDIRSLITRFECGQLPKAEWTHEAHLVVAVWYVTHYPMPEAIHMVRQYISRHNESAGTPNTDTEGYHESITRFWLWVARAFIDRHHPASLGESCHALITSDVGKSSYPLVYYSKELLFSTGARHTWVEPDLKPMKSLIDEV